MFKLRGLWLDANFRRLWVGRVTSLFATELSYVVLPLIAIVFLHATPIQMGVIGAMQGVPAIAGIFLGVWVDRRTRGPILVMVDYGRVVLLAAVPVAYLFDVLSIELLYFVALGMGAMSMLFEIAYRSFMPNVVRRRGLIEANSKLELANSGAVAVGPGIGGALVEIMAAPFALIASIIGFLISAVMYKSIRVTEVVAPRTQDADGKNESVLRGIRNGFSFFRKSKALVGTSAAAATMMLFGTAYDTIYILYLVRNLDFTEGMIGLVFSFGAIGLLGASFVSSWLTDHIGVGKTLILGFVFMGIGGFIVPFAEGSLMVLFATIVIAEIVFLLGIVIWNIGQVSLRQAVTPDAMLGRVTSIQIVTVRAVLPIGAMTGGFLGELMGLRGAMFLFAGGLAAGGVWLLLLGVWKIRELPEAAHGDEAAEQV